MLYIGLRWRSLSVPPFDGVSGRSGFRKPLNFLVCSLPGLFRQPVVNFDTACACRTVSLGVSAHFENQFSRSDIAAYRTIDKHLKGQFLPRYGLAAPLMVVGNFSIEDVINELGQRYRLPLRTSVGISGRAGFVTGSFWWITIADVVIIHHVSSCSQQPACKRCLQR